MAHIRIQRGLHANDFFEPPLKRPPLLPGPIFATNCGVKKFDCIHALKALGEESRMRILRMLMAKERSVNEIAESLGMTQYNVSKHLRVLREASLLEQQSSTTPY